jgi:hypothetical protein
LVATGGAGYARKGPQQHAVGVEQQATLEEASAYARAQSQRIVAHDARQHLARGGAAQ